jgi:hypothetical protein
MENGKKIIHCHYVISKTPSAQMHTKLNGTKEAKDE